MRWQKIDWEQQWAVHAPHYRDGYVHLPLATTSGASPLRLKPGPGFGNLSHPTSRLMLTLLTSHADVFRGQQVIDIGTGSGVLALAAVAVGAKHALAVDIDAEALEHAYGNARLNQMEEQISFCPPEKLANHGLTAAAIFMNMISSEQAIAMRSLPLLPYHNNEWFVSGILSEEKESYTAGWIRKGWMLLEELEEEVWMAMRFHQPPILKNG